MRGHRTGIRVFSSAPEKVFPKGQKISFSAFLFGLFLVLPSYFITIDGSIPASMPVRTFDGYDDGPGSVYSVPFSSSELVGLAVFPGPSLELEKVTKRVDPPLEGRLVGSNVKISSSSIDHDYIRSFGGTGGEEMSSAVRTSDGGFAIVGVTYTYPIGQSSYPNLWLLKLNIEGRELWNRSFGDEGYEYGHDIIELENGDLTLVGTDRPVDKDDTDIWMIGTDSFGNEKWNEIIDLGGDEKVSGLTTTRDGGFVVCGSIMDPLLTTNDLLVVKTGPTGKKVWHSTYGGDGEEEGSDIIEIDNGDLVTLGYVDTDLNGIDQVLLYKTNSTGGELWHKAYGSSNVWESGASLEELENGDLIASGISMTIPGVGLDLVLLRTSKEGVQRWFRTYGGGGNDRGAGLLIDDKGITMTGFSNSYGSGGDNVLLVRTDLSGNHLWTRYYEGSNQDYGVDSFPSKYGHFVLGTSMSFGPGPQGVILLNLSDAFTAVTGRYISDDLLQHIYVDGLKELEYQASIPSGTSVSIMFSTDLSNWSDGMGRSNRSVILYNGGGKVSLPYFSEVWTDFFYSLTFECENGTFSSLTGMGLYYYSRSLTGTMTSPVYEGGPNIEWGEVRIAGTYPEKTATVILARSGMDPSSILSHDFVGPDGELNSSYSDGDRLWSGHAGNSYVQFKVEMSRSLTPLSTPALRYLNLTMDNPSALIDGSVSATTGDIDTLFNFTVTYIDQDYDWPEEVFLNLDGRNMSMWPANPFNGQHIEDGEKYILETNLSIGDHTYRFFATTYGRIVSTGSGTIKVTQGPLTYIEVFPKDMVISADDDVQFFAKGFDRAGNEIEMIPAWDLVGSGTLDDYGYFSPDKVGICTIRASWGGVSGRTNITVRHGALHWIKVSLPGYPINADMIVRFEAYGFDGNDNPVNIVPVWEVTGGGSIDRNGTFDAIKAGFWRVYANLTGVSGLASFQVVPGNLSVIMVEPTQVTLNISDEVKFMALGLDSDGNLLDLSPEWTVSGGGTISYNGLFLAVIPGTWTVFCNSSGKSGTAMITIVQPANGDDDDTDDDEDQDGSDDDEGTDLVKVMIMTIAISVLLIMLGAIIFFLIRKVRGAEPGPDDPAWGREVLGNSGIGADVTPKTTEGSSGGAVLEEKETRPVGDGQVPTNENEGTTSGPTALKVVEKPPEHPSEDGPAQDAQADP